VPERGDVPVVPVRVGDLLQLVRDQRRVGVAGQLHLVWTAAHRRRALYEALLARLAERGFRTAVAGMTLPNDASVGLHSAIGFEPVGTHRRIGWKQDRWHDVAWVQRGITAGEDPPTEPR
jgi:RimJ/RimL family protein N-acetyltransferase